MLGIIVGAGKLVTVGFCLGLGFWACRKLTGKVDEYFVLRDTEYLAHLAAMQNR